MELPDLAKQTLLVLNKQQEYFRARSGTAAKETLLQESKRMEAELRKCCNDILLPPAAPTLFDDDVEEKGRPYWTR